MGSKLKLRPKAMSWVVGSLLGMSAFSLAGCSNTKEKDSDCNDCRDCPDVNVVVNQTVNSGDSMYLNILLQNQREIDALRDSLNALRNRQSVPAPKQNAATPAPRKKKKTGGASVQAGAGNCSVTVAAPKPANGSCAAGNGETQVAVNGNNNTVINGCNNTVVNNYYNSNNTAPVSAAEPQVECQATVYRRIIVTTTNTNCR